MTDVVIDSSAVIAMLTGEPEGGAVAAAIDGSDRLLMSAATLVELGIVLEVRLGPVGGAVVERFLRAGQIEVIAVDREMADSAMDGWRRFRKGRHPSRARLRRLLRHRTRLRPPERRCCAWATTSHRRI